MKRVAPAVEYHLIDGAMNALREAMLVARPENPQEWLTDFLKANPNFMNERVSGIKGDPAVHHCLHSPYVNKGTAFTVEERFRCNVHGLLPPAVETLDQQVTRVLHQFRQIKEPVQKYVFLSNLRENNITLFYATILASVEEILPIIYTPVVGEGCTRFSEWFQGPSGMYITAEDRGHVYDLLCNWTGDVDVIVVTDGSRILGLGDLGSNGMGIPIGKLSLYVAGAGLNPARVLPITIDIGTNNEKFLADPMYLGVRKHRESNDVYYQLMDEFVAAVFARWPKCTLQFEDFSNDHCFDFLARYREHYRTFNDDIQGTGAVIAAGFLNAVQVSGVPITEHRILFFGAGSAAVGVAEQMVAIMADEGMSKEVARKAFYLVDSKGLVTTTRGDELAAHKLEFARSDITAEQSKTLGDLQSCVDFLKPTALIGLAASGPQFTETIVRHMAKNVARPIIFPLSNPTSKSEINPMDAYNWTDGKAIVATGSPYEDFIYHGEHVHIAQGNNMYIFPGLGLGSKLSRPKKITETMILSAAKALASMAPPGQLYPPLKMIREISAHVCAAVMNQARREGLNTATFPENNEELLQFVRDSMWWPKY